MCIRDRRRVRDGLVRAHLASINMCSKTKLGDLKPMQPAGAAALHGVSASWVKTHPDDFLLLDVRDYDEGMLECAAGQVPLGALMERCGTEDKPLPEEFIDSSKTICCVCRSGVRARTAAEQLNLHGHDATFINRGLVEWDAPAATVPGLVVVLSSVSPDQVSIAMSAVATSQKSGVQTVLVVMGRAVLLFRTPAQGIEERELLQGCWAGEPFKRTDALLDGFRAEGGVVLLCTSCVKNKGIDVDDGLVDGVHLMNLSLIHI
eukprot:TRINITY_DN4470_c0_g1_i1.p1 TRINITY_DN4470_c0_g1~~TRINITY_DN4470_c0_g1_i1.p1  ORF type:complete len:262 (-),score=64.33 TRINITY_DN4470_c0_g1_i1:154-939(-)